MSDQQPEPVEHSCGHGSDGFAPLYDVEVGLAEAARARRLRDHVTRATCSIADDLAHNLSAHFSAEELESVGRALVITAASIGALAGRGVQDAVLINLVAFAGQRLVVDARAVDGPLS